MALASGLSSWREEREWLILSEVEGWKPFRAALSFEFAQDERAWFALFFNSAEHHIPATHSVG